MSATAAKLRRQVLHLGGRLDGFGHTLIASSRNPSDPSDVRWDCLCGYGNSPAKVERHWEANLVEYEASCPPETETLEQAAQVAVLHAERLKHTSHRDGLGMGWEDGEELCHEIAERIRALIPQHE